MCRQRARPGFNNAKRKEASKPYEFLGHDNGRAQGTGAPWEGGLDVLWHITVRTREGGLSAKMRRRRCVRG